jgi:feruloyl esterase
MLLIPGVNHALAGPGAGVLQAERAAGVPFAPGRDLLATIMQWVEEGKAPDRFVASRMGRGGMVERTKLLCPEPQTAAYGSGDPMDAANWRCVRP